MATEVAALSMSRKGIHMMNGVDGEGALLDGVPYIGDRMPSVHEPDRQVPFPLASGLRNSWERFWYFVGTF